MQLQADFVLASASPRRADLLRQIGCRFFIAPVDVDESVLPGEPAVDYVQRIALQKARAGWLVSPLSAVAMVAEERQLLRYTETQVTFRTLSPEECERYWQTGEPVDKAGAYAIQGLGGVFVTAIKGSYSSVVGLPLAETCQLLQAFDIAWWRDT
jgi:septum formation protein